MSQWPFGIDSSKAAEIARLRAQEEQKQKDNQQKAKKTQVIGTVKSDLQKVLHPTKE